MRSVRGRQLSARSFVQRLRTRTPAESSPSGPSGCRHTPEAGEVSTNLLAELRAKSSCPGGSPRRRATGMPRGKSLWNLQCRSGRWRRARHVRGPTPDYPRGTHAADRRGVAGGAQVWQLSDSHDLRMADLAVDQLHWPDKAWAARIPGVRQSCGRRRRLKGVGPLRSLRALR